MLYYRCANSDCSKSDSCGHSGETYRFTYDDFTYDDFPITELHPR